MAILTFWTWNKHKLDEVRAILNTNINWYNKEDLAIIQENWWEIPEIQSMNIEAIVKAKALAIYRILQRPVIVEDTWLFIDCMIWFPGPFVKYIVDWPWLWVIIKTMEWVENRVAKAITWVCVYNWNEYITWMWELIWTIPLMPRWDKFWWSNIFEPNWVWKTFWEMTDEEKNQISMRKIALLDFMEKLKAKQS